MVVVTHCVNENLLEPHYHLSRIGIVMIPTQLVHELNKIRYENPLECSKILINDYYLYDFIINLSFHDLRSLSSFTEM